MNILTFLSILLPFVAAATVPPVDPVSGADLQQCRPECKKKFDSCRARDHRPNIAQCKIFVCRIFDNDCPYCDYCTAPNISIRDVDQSSTAAVPLIDTVHNVTDSSAKEDVPMGVFVGKEADVAE